MRCPVPHCRASMTATGNVHTCPDCAYSITLVDPSVDAGPTTLTKKASVPNYFRRGRVGTMELAPGEAPPVARSPRSISRQRAAELREAFSGEVSA